MPSQPASDDLNALYAAAEKNSGDARAWLRLAEAMRKGITATSPSNDRVAVREALLHAATVAHDPELVLRITDALADLGELDSSLALFRRLEQQRLTASPASYETVVRGLLQAERHQDALDVLAPLEPLLDQNPTLEWLRAHTRFALGHLEAALTDVDSVLRRDPESFHSRHLRARILSALGHTEPCVAEWRKLHELRPDSQQVATALGEALTAAEQYDDAISVLRTVVNRHPDFLEARLALGVSLLQARRFEEAEASIQRAIAQNPNAAEAHLELGKIYDGMDRATDAVTSYRRAVELGAAGPRPLLRLAAALHRTNAKEAAEEALMKAAALAPEQPELRAEIAEALAALRANHSPRAAEGAFTGKLATFPLFEVLEILQNRNATGRLELTLPNRQLQLFLQRGTLARFESDSKPPLARFASTLRTEHPTLRSLLSRASPPTDAAILRCLDAQSRQRLLMAQALSTLDPYFDIQQGSFAFHDEPVLPTPSDAHLDLRMIMLETARLRDERGRTRKS